MGASICSIALHLWNTPFAEDDAFIHIRAAKNLWLAGAPFFNTATPCLSSTSVLWFLLIAPTTMLGEMQLPGIATINGLLSVLASLMVAKLSARIFPSLPSWTGTLTAILTYCCLLPSSLALMESSFATTMTSLAVLLLLSKTTLWSALIVLLPLTRPELLVVIPVALAYRALHRSSFITKRAIEWVAPVIIAALVAYLYIATFGAVLPQSMLAKQVVYQLSYNEFIKGFVTALSGGIGGAMFAPAWIITSALLLIAIVFTTHEKSRPSGKILTASMATLCIPILITLGYAIRCVLVFPWYAPLLTVPTVIALTPLLKGGAIPRFFFTVLFAPQLCAALLSALTPTLTSYSPLAPSGARAFTLREIGAALSNVSPTVTIVAPEIGALGMSFPGEIIDAVGLATPHSITYHPLKVPEQRRGGYLGAVPPQLVRDLNPDLVVGLPSLMEALMQDPIIADYREIRIPIISPASHDTSRVLTVWGNTHITVLVRTHRYHEIARALQSAAIIADSSPPLTS